jgi:hypothetical protein
MMTQPVAQYTVGVDVSKNTLDTLDMYELATDRSSVIANDTESIERRLPHRPVAHPGQVVERVIDRAVRERAHGRPIIGVERAAGAFDTHESPRQHLMHTSLTLGNCCLHSLL